MYERDIFFCVDFAPRRSLQGEERQARRDHHGLVQARQGARVHRPPRGDDLEQPAQVCPALPRAHARAAQVPRSQRPRAVGSVRPLAGSVVRAGDEAPQGRGLPVHQRSEAPDPHGPPAPAHTEASR